MRAKITSVLAALLVVVSLSGCVVVSMGGNGSGVRGQGPQITHQLQPGQFERIHISGSWDVVYRHAPQPALTVIIEQNLFELLDISVEQGQLNIRPQANIQWGSTSSRIYIYAPSLEELNFAGAGHLRDWEPLSAESFALNLSGAVSGEISGLDVDSFSANLSGAVSASLSGRADSVNIITGGAVSLQAQELQAHHAWITASGASSIDIAASYSLNVIVSGGGRVRYVGNPQVTQSVSGAGTVSQLAG